MLTEAIIELVKANFGVAALAKWAVQPFLDAGSVVPLPIPPRGLGRHWSAVMFKHMAGTDHVTAFVDLLGRGAPGRNGRSTAKPRAKIAAGIS
jgi:LysR family transcriptional regulator for metE and metH